MNKLQENFNEGTSYFINMIIDTAGIEDIDFIEEIAAVVQDCYADEVSKADLVRELAKLGIEEFSDNLEMWPF